MSIILKSNVNYSGASLYPAGFLEYMTRVKADGGTVGDPEAVFTAYRAIERLGIPLSKVKALISPAFGYQLIGNLVNKLYNLSNSNDFTISGTRDGTGPMLSTANGYNEIVFNDVPGTTQKTLQASFASSAFTFSSIHTSVQLRFDNPQAIPIRGLSIIANTGNTYSPARAPETLGISSTDTFEKIGNGLRTSPPGNYISRTHYMASAFARVSPATTSRRRIANGRINIVDQLETTGAFDASSGFNGSLLAYSGTNTTYTQGPGYGCGALTMLIDLTDEQIFGLLEKIS